MAASALKISSKITGFKVGAKAAEKAAGNAPPAHVNALVRAIVAMNEKLERPEMLVGSTYKLKTPVSEHAMYITINDIVLNEGTEHEQRRPFEIFINSKNLEHYQWVVALTRIMSAVFRKGGDVNFLVDELKSVFDPKGGYWQAGGKFMPSIIAELGHIIERHFKTIGLIKDEQMDAARVALIAEKRKQYEAKQVTTSVPAATEKKAIPGARDCSKCYETAVVVMDGCETCLECGNSKCG